MNDDDYHWRVMRRAIERLDSGTRPMALSEIAAEMGMSPAHFQRVFSAWVGISPKRYQSYLALGHARRMLAERHTAIEAADAAGLSGTGRLHDLFVTWEAMSPGAYARRGAGLTIRYARADGPFGPMIGMATGRGLCGLALTADIGDAAGMADLRARWPAAEFVADADALAPHFAAIGARAGTRLHVMGGPFQIKVWEALLHVPEGRVTTYGDLATAAGNPRAHRAAGAAVGANPIAWLVPCHRVLRASGALGGYHWGLPVKRALLACEAVVTAEHRGGESGEKAPTDTRPLGVGPG